MEEYKEPYAEEWQTVDTRPIRRTYSWVGICFAVLLIVATAAQLVLSYVPHWVAEDPATVYASPWWVFVVSSLPMYLLAFPLCFAMMRRLPASAPTVQPLSGKQLLTYIPISVAVMYAGNLIGTMLSLLLSGGTAENAVAQLAMENHPLKFVVMVLAAPVFEEWICRKVLLDRIGQHGVLLSAVMSGAVFGLLHQNFFQFFYAFALGFLFAWMYLQNGRIWVPMAFHMGINFLGAVVAPAVLKLADLDALQQADIDALSPQTLLPMLGGMAVMMLYGSLMVGLTALGVVLLIRRLRRGDWRAPQGEPPLRQTLRPALLNVGMMVYIALCTAAFVWSLLANLIPS